MEKRERERKTSEIHIFKLSTQMFLWTKTNLWAIDTNNDFSHSQARVSPQVLVLFNARGC